MGRINFQNAGLRKAEALLRATIENAPEGVRAKFEAMAALDYETLIALQNAQSRLFAAGLIRQDFAQDVYNAIGESCTTFETLPVEQRIIVMQAGKVLIEKQAGGQAS